LIMAFCSIPIIPSVASRRKFTLLARKEACEVATINRTDYNIVI